jgi:N-acyl-D-amino-acid deacylase
MMRTLLTVILFLLLFSCSENKQVKTSAQQYDVIIRNGTIYDGSGSAPVHRDVAIRGDRIAAVGNLGSSSATNEVDARGLAVAPGFINMLSWATDSLIADGHSESDLRQGVTLEIFGEGWSEGPYTEKMKVDARKQQGDIKYEIAWNTPAEYLDFLQKKGISTNVGTFVGATTVRIHEVGYEDRPPTAEELQRMQDLVRQSMREGAFGLGSSLIYAPAFYAKTDELIALAKAASEYGGMYISHMRSEGNQLLEAVDELIRIAREANIPAEIYHLKAAGVPNWPKLDAVIEKVEKAQQSGLHITADMYTYTAGATGLDASMPPWVQEGGLEKWIERLKDPQTREKVKTQMDTAGKDWENLYYLAGSPDKILLVAFKNPQLKSLTGKSLAEVARMRDKSPEETAMDLVIEDDSRVGTVYFLMSEDNIKKQLNVPWVSFGSDEGSLKPEGVFLLSNPHPRAYGNFARVLGKYVRDEHVLPLESAIHRLSALPASNLKIADRGLLKTGYFADVVVFDPATIADHATFEQPHQFATGMVDVFVNGVQVLKNGQHTGATPGRALKGPGYGKK